MIKRLENFSSKDAAAIAVNFFDEYRSIYNSSYLDNSFDYQEDFAGEYINSNDFFNSDDNEFCDWPDPNCNAPINPPLCPVRPENNFITLLSRPCVYSTILSDECGKQFNTLDCDYIYDWSVTVDEHNNPENYRFYWWTDNILYRIIYAAGAENSNISGVPKANSPKRMSVFLGNRHAAAIGFGWPFYVCKYELWIYATRFGAFDRNLPPCGFDNIGIN